VSGLLDLDLVAPLLLIGSGLARTISLGAAHRRPANMIVGADLLRPLRERATLAVSAGYLQGLRYAGYPFGQVNCTSGSLWLAVTRSETEVRYEGGHGGQMFLCPPGHSGAASSNWSRVSPL
jgi:hypothetical protein